MAETRTLVVNGESRSLRASPDQALLWALRDDLALTGTKYSCLEGICGACTVLADGEPIRSCVTPLDDVEGRSITTVEGLARDGRLHPLQQAFIEEGAFQCGFCTSGQLLAAAALLERDPDPDEAAIREAMDGNVCRCCAYHGIARAIHRAAELPDGAATAQGSPVATAPADHAPPELARPPRPWDLQEPMDRGYFDLLGEGLVVVVPPSEGRGGWVPSGGAWLHIGPAEVVTAFTGKVDVGQDNRTALSIVVADELRTSLDAVRLVMGDTDVCPYDMGTFGSLSMPVAAPALRQAAATARGVLVGLAAERWQTTPEQLEARNCGVVRADGVSLGYGELVRGLRRVEIAPAHLKASAGGGVAGLPAARLTGSEIVTGRHEYVLDIVRPGMLVGLVLRPPSFGARLRSVDTEPARAIPDVVVIAEEGFIGVAAPDVTSARVALRAIRAEWLENAGIAEGEIIGHLRSHPVEAHGWGGAIGADDPDANSGDVDAALATTAHRLQATYTTAYLAHVPLETRDAVAEWDGERLTVWTGTQRPFGVREQVAEALGLAEEAVRVIVPDTGGGFGGKHTGEVAIEAARLARAARRPVQVRWTREEEMTWAYFRPYAVIDVRAGLAADGGLTAWEFTNINSGANAIHTPYEVANRRIRYQPADSPLRIGSYRALAATANTFARESAVDELAAASGADPLAFRLRHLADDRLAAVLRSAAEHAGWPATDRASRRALGIAGGVEKGGRVATVADIRVAGDGRLDILRLVTAFECGAIVNPTGLRSQVEGAAVMGLGGALFEAVHFADGRILTPTLKEYRVPRMRDVPPIEVVLVDRPDLPSAGAGETPIIAVAPAIANAIFVATGTRLRSLPLVPDGRIAAVAA